eukprot:jgi/Botrbrau1/14276/Bobra.0368s0008.1
MFCGRTWIQTEHVFGHPALRVFPGEGLQVPNSYQPANELYCVRAKYTAKNPENVTEGIIVQKLLSHWRSGQRATSAGTSGIGNGRVLLAARIYNSSQPSKLAVGPAFPGFSLPPSAFGPYWVVAAGNSQNLTASQPGFPGYDWAIVTAGPPGAKSESGKGCRTGPPSLRWRPSRPTASACGSSAESPNPILLSFRR